LITYFSDFRYVYPFRIYLRSNSKVVKNRVEFWTFFCHPKFSSVHPFQNLCPRCHPGFEPYPLVMFCEVTACIHRYATAKVIGAHIWNLSPIFMVTLKILGDHRPRLWCALASLGQTLARVKISGPCSNPKGRNIVSRKKSTCVGPNSHVLIYG